MPRFEVYVPPAPPRLPVAVALRVESENWLAALKVGLQKVGGGELASNILCDIQADGSIHVTDPDSGRVFRIREVEEASAPAAPPAVPETGPSRPRPSAAARKVEEMPAPAEQTLGRIGRGTPEIQKEDALADVFFRAADLHARHSRDDGLRFLLDLAMEKVRCESGSVFLASLGGTDLAFAVARGPKADEVLRLGIRVPMGVGIVGFCAQENVCLAVSDAEKDPRFFRTVSDAVGYATHSLLCAPVAAAGRVWGALELLNKAGGKPFEGGDLAVLSYLAHRAAEFLARVEG
jgi:hypothetical protein